MKIYLAGISTDKEQFYNQTQVKNILISYLEVKQIDMSKIVVPNLLLDSGAFSYLNSKKNAVVDWDQYIESYAKVINLYKINLFFELDIDPIVGLKEVERLRKKLEKITNKQCIPVWHKSRGLEYWKKMCEGYKYVAIGGIVTKEIKQTEYDIFIPLLKIAKEKSCKVHGLGFTRTRALHRYKFYSVDSTNWITTRFNMYYLFNSKRGIMQSNKKNTDTGKLRVKNNSMSEYNKMQIQEWVKYAEYAEINL